MARYYSDQYLSDFWAASPEVMRTALVEMAPVAVRGRGLAVDGSVLVPLAVGAALLLLLK